MTSDSPPKRPHLPRSIWALGFVSLLMDVSSELVHSLLPLFMVSSLGISVFAVGLLEGAAEATALVVKVFSGAASDYLRKRKTLAVLGYGLAAVTKPLFALASSFGLILTARIIDRIGKGIRDAPRDALIADITEPEMRGAAYGLRQSLDTVGAFVGPLLAMGLMLLWANDFRAVFWVALIPACMAVAVLLFGVQEPVHQAEAANSNPVRWDNVRRMGRAYWWVVAAGAVVMMARFSEAFLLLRAHQGGLALAFAPLVMVAMNVVYSLSAYPFGRLADKMSRTTLLVWGLLALIVADIVLASGNSLPFILGGVALWGVHLGLTQGLLSAMVADAAPADLRGTAFGLFNLAGGVALLLGGALAGWLWDSLGAPYTFGAGALFCALAVIVILLRRPSGRAR
ncbi:MAG: ral substrate transporter:Major facilitator superfamily 1 [Burkholderiaceae bacterium]|nr:ral substrate transporter:Major facilitator superfamily 1 [Burkholderiaceae bacterium]